MIGLARSVGWLSMYVGLPWAMAGRAASRRPRMPAWPRSPASAWSPREPRRDPRHVPHRRLDRERGGRELGPRVFAIIRDLPPIDAVRISVGFWNTEEELERFARAVEPLASAHARHAAAAPDPHHAGQRWRTPRLTVPPGRGGGASSRSAGASSGAPHGRSSGRSSAAWRSRSSSGSRTWPTTSRSIGGDLPGGDLRLAFLTLYVVLVLLVGSVVTYLVVPVPSGPGAARRTRTPWSLALGLFAAVPLAYLVLVVLHELVKPLLV